MSPVMVAPLLMLAALLVLPGRLPAHRPAPPAVKEAGQPVVEVEPRVP